MNKEELCNFICEITNTNACSEMILRQIHKYVRECGYSYKDIARALSYYVDVQNNTLELKYGIAIVKLVMKDAQAYYKKLEIQKQNQIKAARQIKNTFNNCVQCKISGKKTIKKRQIDISQM